MNLGPKGLHKHKIVNNLSSSATRNLNYGSIFVEGSIVNILAIFTICIMEAKKKKVSIVNNLGVSTICNPHYRSGNAEGNSVRKLKVSIILNPYYGSRK